MKRYLNHIQRYWKRLKIQSKTAHDAQRPESRKTRVLVSATPRQVSKLVMSVTSASVYPLASEFDDDAEGGPV